MNDLIIKNDLPAYFNCIKPIINKYGIAIDWAVLVKKRPSALTNQQMSPFLFWPEVKYLVDTAENIDKSMLFYTMFMLGARISEVKLLTRQSFSFDSSKTKESHVMVANLKQRKKKIPKRYVPLASDDYILKMKQYLNSKGGLATDYIFPKSRKTYWLWFAPLTDIIGFKISTHTMRHSMAMHQIFQGIDINDIASFLGHKELNSTRVYTKIGMEMLSVTRPKIQF